MTGVFGRRGQAALIALTVTAPVAACSAQPDQVASSTTGRATARQPTSTSSTLTSTPAASGSPAESSPTPPVSSPPVTNPHAASCTAAVLNLTGPLSDWGGISQTQQLTYQVTNVSDRDCSLKGYPQIRFYGSGAQTFTYRQGGTQGPGLSNKPPSRVVLAAHGWAYLQILRRTCESIESAIRPRTLRITLPNTTRVFVERLSPTQGFPTCSAGPSDFGSLVYISPIRLNADQIIGV